jgi:predicted ATPase/DNA-binding winged helix-turn-helix (wHTH) protein/Tfp pilus assembly protein PilF
MGSLKFGLFELSSRERVLWREGLQLPLGSRALDILVYLAERPGAVIPKKELIDHVWSGVAVEEGTLRVHVAAIRKALCDGRSGNRYIANIKGKGYSFVGTVVRFEDGKDGGSNRPNFRGRLPAQPLMLIGREAAVRSLRDLVSAYRVVTLTGPGGIGKSSLAIEAGHGILGDFQERGCLVELASLADEDLVPSAVANVLGMKLLGRAIAAEAVAQAIGNANLLLILDNCEHVIGAVAELVEAVVRFCPRVHMLATSREVLRIDGEQVYRVPPLGVPEVGEKDPERVLRCGAVELLIARTRGLDSAFTPTTGDIPSIAAICRQLDGIPLAIEFAAARAAAFGFRRVAAGLGDRFRLLTRGRRTALPRHQTLRAALDWSHELLPDAERRLLRRLGVFAGGFTVDSIAAVMTDTGLDAAMVTNCIAELVTKSLIALDPTPGATRWYLLETIRAYALQKLAESGESDDARRRHAAFFRDLLAPVSVIRSRFSDQDLKRCVREIDNVRAALDWSFSSVGDGAIGIDLTAAYSTVWRHLSLMNECRERCERALLSLEPHLTANMPLRMELQMALASAILITMGSPEQAKTLLTEALETADALNDLNAQASTLSTLLVIYAFRGEYDRAQTAVERIEQIAHRTGDPVHLRSAYEQMGATLLTRGRPREAQQYLERVLRSPEVRGDRHGAIYYNSNDHAAARAWLARALWMQGFTEQALNEARLSLNELQGRDHQLLLCRTLYHGICRIATMIGDLATADREIARLIEVATGLNAHFWETAGRFLEGKLLIDRGKFAQGLLVLRDAFKTCDRTGWTLSYPEFKGVLAVGLAGLGRLEEALIALEDAMAADREGGHEWYVPELLRVKGEVLLQQAADQSALAAEDCFNRAAQMAREQGALFWELRIALSVARLRVSQGRRHEARAPLASVYDRFTEGFATADLQAARSLLEGLPP